MRAATWWGAAWIEALEHTSLDSGRLSRGRTYARQGRIGPITVSPGRIGAAVYGSRSTPYAASLQVEMLGDDAWDALLDQVAGQAAHIAALLDGEVPHELVEDAADVGVPLLPGLGDLDPECSCPDWGYPCKHAAALAYQTSWLLDADPFVLLLMRGRGRGELVGELQRRNDALAGSPAARPGASDPRPPAGDLAGDALTRPVPPLPDVPPLPADAAVAQPLASAEAAEGVDPASLGLLVADAAARARAILAGSEEPPLDLWRDAVRLAATRPGEDVVARLADATGRGRDLPRAVSAWRCAGTEGLDVLERSWTPERLQVARAWSTLEAASDEPMVVRQWRNRWTIAALDVQLRLGRDGRWHPYRREHREWWPAGPPAGDAAEALARLG